MTRFSIDLDSQLDELGAEARARLAATPGQPTHAEVIAEMFRAMVRRFNGGYHPDTPSDEYASYPDGLDPELVAAIEILADEAGLNFYDLAIEAAAWQPGDPIDYSHPDCTCRMSGMGRRADCPVHGVRK
jgi:hypothetical protein